MASAMCQAGEKATGGGASSSDPTLEVTISDPLEATGDPAEAGDTPVGWGGANLDNPQTDTTTAFVVCVS
jgi:hypothetical protein